MKPSGGGGAVVEYGAAGSLACFISVLLCYTESFLRQTDNIG